ncbi:heme/hemin ABC transporter substrate-binding protein [Micrococcoides hystricis]|uniref:Hemin ABC transporter substrate-binding protein n=1 Tax=Micrococcoides hystricis TaxID=1572761 RepID=A0ABV6PAL7_9MICC
MNKWLNRLLVGGTSILASLLLVTSCSSPIPAGTDATEEASAASSHSSESPTPSTSAVEPLSLPSGPVSIAPVPAVEPVSSKAEPALPVTFKDVTGGTHEITDTSRVLALDIYGTFVETIIALGEQDKLVGRTSSNTQPEIADLPMVTVGGHQLNAEAILNLQPTLVIADKTLGPPEVLTQLADAGIPVVYLDAKRTLATMPTMIQDLSDIMGVADRGEELSEEISQRLEQVTEQIKARSAETQKQPAAAFLYIRGSGSVFFIFGKDSGADDLITSLGLKDVASEKGITDYKPATAEALAELAPDVLIVMSSGLESGGGIEELLKRPGVAQTPAGKNKRIIDLPDGQSLSFGPSYPDMVEKIIQEAFTADSGK